MAQEDSSGSEDFFEEMDAEVEGYYDYDEWDILYRRPRNTRNVPPSRYKEPENQERPDSPNPRPLKRRLSNQEKLLDEINGYHVNPEVKESLNMVQKDFYDHTYNAVAFNVHTLPGENVVQIRGFSVMGRLRRMRIYMMRNYDCHFYRTDARKWTLVYDKVHAQSWNDLQPLMLDKPIMITPSKTVAFYIHSDDDTGNGIKYRSVRQPGVVFADENIAVTHGYAHTSMIPFSLETGWFRERRCLTGNILYDKIPIRWSEYSHDLFPNNFREVIKELRKHLSRKLRWPPGVIYTILSFLPFDSYGLDVIQKDFLEEIDQIFKNNTEHYASAW